VKQFYVGISVMLSIFISSAPVIGQNIYRWTDEKGRVHFSNAPVKEAQSVDDELPPAANFGGAQDIFASPEDTSSNPEKPSDATSSKEKSPEENQDTENGVETQDPDRAEVTNDEAQQTGNAEDGESGAEDTDAIQQEQDNGE